MAEVKRIVPAPLSVPFVCAVEGEVVWQVTQSAVAAPSPPSASKLPSCALLVSRGAVVLLCRPLVGLTATVVVLVWQ